MSRRKHRGRWTASLLLLGTVMSSSGCHREWYRQQADEEAQSLINEKAYNRWSTPYRGVTMDPRSRFYDAHNPDRPPMPPDDPESHRLMHRIDGKKHWKHWHDNGEISELQNPDWRAHLIQESRLTDDGKVVLALPDSVRLALIHSPTYQQQLETIYLSALDVSTERFRLDTQFYGGIGGGSNGRTFFNNSSIETSSLTKGGDNSQVAANTNLGVRRNLATAGELIIGFVNSFVWQFSDGQSNFSTSLVNFTLMQPLLRGAGRQIALEQLTIAERTLLSNLRAFEAYRQGFYTQIAIGENNAAGPSRRGGFQGAGLSGFTGLGTGGFSGVGDATGFGRTNNTAGGTGGGVGSGAGFAGGGAGNVGGYIGLLQVRQQIRNTEASLRAQLQTLELLEAHLDAGLIDIAQVDQFRQSIETERANLLQTRNALQTQLDTYKTGTLGLPPDLPLELDDEFIKPFQLLDPGLQKVQADLQAIVHRFGELPIEATAQQHQAVLADLLSLKPLITEQFDEVAGDLQRLELNRPQRVQKLEPVEQKLFDRDRKQLADNLQELRERANVSLKKIDTVGAALTDDNLKQNASAIININGELANILSELALIQARARVETISVDAIELAPETAIEIARANRFDWMNNRAQLVDTWRLIEFNANQLESNLDIYFKGDLGATGSDPLKLGVDQSSIQAGVRFDAPFNRLNERNNFRQQLLVYQQQRRQLITYEDTVHRTLRQLLRDMEQLRVNLDIQRRAVAIAIRRADQTRENLNKPTPPAQPGQAQSQFGPTAATNLLTALSDLRNSQNNFMSVWLNYYAGRMRLMRELGIMRLDDQGNWIDEPIEASLQHASGDVETLPPEVPKKWFDALDAADERDRQGQGAVGKTPHAPAPGPGKSIPVPAPAPALVPPPMEDKAPATPEPRKLPGAKAGRDMPGAQLQAPRQGVTSTTSNVIPTANSIAPATIGNMPASSTKSGWRPTK